MKPHIFFYCNGLAIWHGVQDISHINVNYGRESAYMRVDIFKGISLPQTEHFVLL